MDILSIETSCDDTSVAIVQDGFYVLSSVVATQLEHDKYGGVVPEVAAREHLANIIYVLDQAIKEAEVTWEQIDAITVTKGPGLVGSLLVGISTAKTLALLHKKPLVAVHHTEGHIYANWLGKDKTETPKFPLVALTVSGGHTNIIYMENDLKYQIIGETQDDAAGEAYDKVSKMLGYGYPGGPIIAGLSQEGNPDRYVFPQTDLTSSPKRDDEGYLREATPSLNFSYSGLKTAVLREVKKITTSRPLTKTEVADLAASFQQAANMILIRNLSRAVNQYKPASILLAGGVISNLSLRKGIIAEFINNPIPLYFPESKYCTDNAAMIAAAGYRHFLKSQFTKPQDLEVNPNLNLTTMS